MSKNEAALLPQVKGSLEVKEVPYPEPSETQIVIKIESAAMNPVDWKQQEIGFFISSYPFILGYDAAGTVDKVGAQVKNFKVGDRVAAFLPAGGYQKYVAVTPARTFIAPNNITFDQASAIPVAVTTAAEGLFNILSLEKPSLTTSQKRDKTILVWGGASIVGLYTIQLASNAGYRVLSTASPANFALVKSFGAEQVFDYKDEDVVKKIQAAGKVDAVFDAIAHQDTLESSAQVLQPHGGKIAATLAAPEATKVPENVKIGSFHASNAFVENGGALAKWLFEEYTVKAIEKGLLSPVPIKVIPGGLKEVQNILTYGKAGKVSAEKILVNPQK